MKKNYRSTKIHRERKKEKTNHAIEKEKYLMHECIFFLEKKRFICHFEKVVRILLLYKIAQIGTTTNEEKIKNKFYI